MRTIDADATKKAITEYFLKCVDNGKVTVDVTEAQINIFNIINNQPTVNNESVKGDWISRAKLLEKMNDTGVQITFDLPVEEILGEDVDIDDFSMLVQDAIQAYRKMVIDTIQNQPTVSNDGWIACSERLPEEGMTVLTQDFEDYYEVCNVETKNGVIGFSSGDWWASANNYLAWHSLPQPYKENENETT